MITIIDYGSGNLKSISNGFSHIGKDVKISKDPQELKTADALILPGVGAFGTAMGNLKDYEDVIHNHVDDGKPFLGVCLGLQVLFESSQESPNVNGLNIFAGEVVKFPHNITESGLKIPHMGWNQLHTQNDCPILRGLNEEYMYFVHSYYVQPRDSKIIVATVDYGIDVPAAVFKKNVFATQFHPEKSGEPGLQILKNFLGQYDCF